MKTTLSMPPLAALACAVLGQLVFAHSLQAGDLAPTLQPFLVESKLPSIAAAVVIGDKIEGSRATGVRKLDEPTPVTVNDKSIVVTTNSGAANAFETCDKVVVKLLQKFAK